MQRQSQLHRGSFTLRRSRMKPKPYRSAATRAGMVQLLDILTSKIVRLRDKCCTVCGSTYDLQCGHYWKRATHATRFDLVNCNALCARCNYRDNIDHDPYSFAMLEKYGGEEMEKLRDRFFSGRKFTDADLQRLIVEYKEKLRTMQ